MAEAEPAQGRGGARFIETLPRKGYLFIAAVESANGLAVSPVPKLPAASTHRELMPWVLFGATSVAFLALAAA